jgi:hypothetical protein
MEEESETLDPVLPPTDILATLGTVNLAWSLFEAQITAALFSPVGLSRAGVVGSGFIIPL